MNDGCLSCVVHCQQLLQSKSPKLLAGFDQTWQYFLCGNSLITVQMVSFHSINKSGCPLVMWPFFFKVREKSVHPVK